MSTRFQRALLSCLFVQTFLAASVPVMAIEPTALNVGPGNNLSIIIDGPITNNESIEQNGQAKTSSVVVDSPKGWDQTTSVSTSLQSVTPKHAPVPGPALRVNHPTINHKKVERPAASRTLGMATLPCEAVDTTETNLTVVDNDLEKEKELLKEESYANETTDANGNTKITAGSRFRVTVLSTHNSHTAKLNDPVEARLRNDLVVGGKVVAKAGSKVVGRVSTAAPARRILSAELSTKRWMRANGALGLNFYEIVTDAGEHLPLAATPAQQSRVVKNVNEGRVLGVNHNGEIASPLSIQLKHQAAHLAIRGAASAGGVFSFGIVPVAYACIGAANPSFAFMHPVGKNVRHRRLKGFGMGLVAGMPGGFLIADSIIKGQEAVVKPGDEFLAEFKQDFTGEPETDASIMSSGQGKVHGQVLKTNGK
ncbi:MAG: hypothetical protein C0469_15510 [Cyanobacteria bacterium DS2.3.42]|nr:hypothetical protein [Cyanobacteria bacterium DS2.3.42]